MLNCPLCSLKFATLVVLRSHLNYIHRSEWRIPFKCAEDQCFKSYDLQTRWARHMRTAHNGLFEELSPIPEVNPEESGPDTSVQDMSLRDFDPEVNFPDPLYEPKEPDLVELRADIETSAVQFVAGLRSNSSVTTNVCELAINACNDVSESVVTYLKLEVSRFFKEHSVEVDGSELFMRFDELTRPLEFLSTEKKQHMYFSRQPGFVEPETIAFGPPRFEPRNVPGSQPKQKAVHDTWQYVSIGKTLSAVLSIPELLDRLSNTKQDECEETLITDLADGNLYKQHPLVKDGDKFVAALQLYYDDFEVVNPLGPNAGLHKQGVFYFTIRNLPPFFTSTMANIHLTAIGKSIDFKNYSYEQILEKIAKELDVLSTKGIEIEIPGRQTVTVYGFLIAVNGDNLGRHTILGLMESFRSTHFCSQCMCLNAEIQSKFEESDFEMRSKNAYEQQLSQVLEAKDTGTRQQYEQLMRDYGIKRDCPLNGATGWHLTKNKVGDLMHDFLEGVGEFELKLVLYHLVEVQKLFSLEELKGRIGLFPYGMMDQRNRPREIMNLRDVADKNDHSLKQTAMDFWCLFRLLPQMINDLVPPENVYWQFYLDLREIADILFAQVWSRAMIDCFRQLYSEHLHQFIAIFPRFRLIPKHHMLLHYGTYTENTGPPIQSMVAPEEMKGNYFKRTAHIMCNFKNVSYSFAKKNQYFSYFNLITGKMLKDRLEVHKSKAILSNSLPQFEEIEIFLQLDKSQLVTAMKRWKFRGQEYRSDQILAVYRDAHGTPQFGRIELGFSKDFTANSLHFLCQMYQTIGFERHRWCYIVKNSTNFKFCSFKSILDFHPLDCYKTRTPNEFQISVRYQI